jgi:serine/threonine protein kinase
MALSAGTRLGPYEVLAPIGAGGMGEVYKARDTRLDRDIALKILPASVAIDAGRKRRFDQEARAASALNHPNIVSVYDVGTEGDTLFIVTEFIDGESLRSVIQRGPPAIRTMLDLAVQMADGLAAAHAAGIVHRDLKPENVMVTRDGRVKILDFGLAKPVAPAIGQSDVTVRIDVATEPGVILGTVSYFSPEQARGSNELDGRSDQFSFGLMLYELLDGSQPFDRRSAPEIMSAIIRDEAPPLSASAPIPFRLTIERCLAKEPSQRYDTTRDLFLELRHLRDRASEIATGPQVARSTVDAKVQQRSTLWLWSTMAVLVLAGVYVHPWALKTPPPSFERLTYRRGDIPSAKFSPDGQTVVFSAQWAGEPTTTFSMRPGSRESRPLDLPESRILSISSAGEMAILLGPTTSGTVGTLARVPLSGGAPREILENVNDADWSPDGANLAVSRRAGGRNRIEYPIGTVRYESDGRPPQLLRVSPQGDRIAFFEPDSSDYTVTVLDMKGRKQALSRGWRELGGLEWSPKGDEIWLGGAKTGGEPALRAVSLAGKERMLAEPPATMLINDVTRDQKVLVTVVDSRIGISAMSPGAKQERDLSWFDASRIFDISSDGSSILFEELSYGKALNPAIYLRKTDGSPAVRLGDCNRPALSPDGKWVACIMNDGLKTELTLLPTGAGEARNISTAGMQYERVEWFPDGQKLLFTGNGPDRRMGTYLQDVRGGGPMAVTPEGVSATRVSPDGKYVTAVAGGKLSVLPIAGTEPKAALNIQPGETVIRWSADERFLFLRQMVGLTAVKINRLDLASGREEPWKELKPPDPVGVRIIEVVVTPDGNAYAYSFQRDICTLYLASGLK